MLLSDIVHEASSEPSPDLLQLERRTYLRCGYLLLLLWKSFYDKHVQYDIKYKTPIVTYLERARSCFRPLTEQSRYETLSKDLRAEAQTWTALSFCSWHIFIAFGSYSELEHARGAAIAALDRTKINTESRARLIWQILALLIVLRKRAKTMEIQREYTKEIFELLKKEPRNELFAYQQKDSAILKDMLEILGRALYDHYYECYPNEADSELALTLALKYILHTIATEDGSRLIEDHLEKKGLANSDEQNMQPDGENGMSMTGSEKSVGMFIWSNEDVEGFLNLLPKLQAQGSISNDDLDNLRCELEDIMREILVYFTMLEKVRMLHPNLQSGNFAILEPSSMVRILDVYRAVLVCTGMQTSSRMAFSLQLQAKCMQFLFQYGQLEEEMKVDSINKAIAHLKDSLSRARQLLHGDVNDKDGDVDIAEVFPHWSHGLHELLVLKYKYHLFQEDGNIVDKVEGCQEVVRIVKDELKLTEIRFDSETPLGASDVDQQSALTLLDIKGKSIGKAHAMLTYAWLSFLDYCSKDTECALREHAIKHAKVALEIAEDQEAQDSIVFSHIRHSLCVFYQARYDCTGDLDDLNAAAQHIRKCVRRQEHNPAVDIDTLLTYVEHWVSLAAVLALRHQHTGNFDDLEMAINYTRLAVENSKSDTVLCASYQVAFSGYLWNKWSRNIERFSHEERRMGLENALERVYGVRSVIDGFGTPKMKVDCLICISKLECALFEIDLKQCKKSSSHKPDHERLQRSISAARQAEKIPGLQRVDIVEVFTTLSHCFSVGRKDLESAVLYARKALESYPSTRFRRILAMHILAKRLSQQYKEKRCSAVLAEMLKYFREVIALPNGTPLVRILAARRCAEILRDLKQYEDLFAVCADAVTLLPLLRLKSLQQQDQQEVVKQISWLGSTACAAALECGRSQAEALSYLEYGRDILSGNRYDTRIDISALEAKHPNLADEFQYLRRRLDPARASIHGLPRTRSGLLTPPLSNGGSFVRDSYIRVNDDEERFARLIERIRKLPGFEKFLAPPSEEEMKAAVTADNAIVVVNVAKWRSDALVVRQKKPIGAISLDEFGWEALYENLDIPVDQEHGVEELPLDPGLLSSNYILSWLWDALASPVLDKLGYEPRLDGSGSENLVDLPRVWWIMTGRTSQLPVHAAVGMSGRPQSKVMNHVVSSYISSIKALLFAKQQQLVRRKESEGGAKLALLCAMERTPKFGLNTLPWAGEEVEMVRKTLENGGITVNSLKEPSEAQVLSYFDTRGKEHDPNQLVNVFHFAGHGKDAKYDPSQSCLYLRDNTLTVEEFLRLKVYETSPALAYLSACSTGVTTQLPDEGIHILSAFLAAGFQNVIGTLWDVSDDTSVRIATTFYEKWMNGGCKTDRMAYHLHDAIMEVRKNIHNKVSCCCNSLSHLADISL